MGGEREVILHVSPSPRLNIADAEGRLSDGVVCESAIVEPLLVVGERRFGIINDLGPL